MYKKKKKKAEPSKLFIKKKKKSTGARHDNPHKPDASQSKRLYRIRKAPGKICRLLPLPLKLTQQNPSKRLLTALLLTINVSKAPKQCHQMNTKTSNTHNWRSCIQNTPQQFHADYGKQQLHKKKSQFSKLTQFYLEQNTLKNIQHYSRS